MPISPCFFFKNVIEFLPIEDIKTIPNGVRGIYVLHLHEMQGENMDVVYVGMARGDVVGVKARLERHKTSKENDWTHFSVFEVWDNISKQQVEELEGLFRHIYRRDSVANKFNVQKNYSPLEEVTRKSVADWRD